MTDEAGRSKGFGFVSVMDAEKGHTAVSKLHLKLVRNTKFYKNEAKIVQIDAKFCFRSSKIAI